MKKAFACIAILAVVCGVVWHFCNPLEILWLRDRVASFDGPGLAVNHRHAMSIFTSKGSFAICNCEAKRHADGSLEFDGPVINGRYFVAPPMCWARDMAEAQRLATIHYVLHGGDPIVTSSSGPTTFPNPE